MRPLSGGSRNCRTDGRLLRLGICVCAEERPCGRKYDPGRLQGIALTIDLNLLKIFDAVMVDRNLTQAARRLGKTQSAVSHALNRLRDEVGDQLFERTGTGVRPTPRAMEMEKDVWRALTILDSVVQRDTNFDPANEERTLLLTIAAGFDWVVAPRLAGKLASLPRLTVKITNGRASELLSELRYRETWLALDYLPLRAAGYETETLINDEVVLVARQGHPKFKKGMDVGALRETGQVGVGWSTIIQPINHPLYERVSDSGLPSNVRLWVPTLASMYAVVSSTDLVAYAVHKTAKQFAATHKLQIYDLPAKIRSMPLIMVWHESFRDDAGHRWLRDTVREICKGL